MSREGRKCQGMRAWGGGVIYRDGSKKIERI